MIELRWAIYDALCRIGIKSPRPRSPLELEFEGQIIPHLAQDVKLTIEKKVETATGAFFLDFAFALKGRTVGVELDSLRKVWTQRRRPSSRIPSSHGV